MSERKFGDQFPPELLKKCGLATDVMVVDNMLCFFVGCPHCCENGDGEPVLYMAVNRYLAGIPAAGDAIRALTKEFTDSMLDFFGKRGQEPTASVTIQVNSRTGAMVEERAEKPN